MTTNIWHQFDKATKAISAYAILKDGEYVGRIVFKNGAAMSCYLQVWGSAMVKGQARGGGYDRATAAAHNAAARLDPKQNLTAVERIHVPAIKAALLGASDDGTGWIKRLEGAGYTVCGVI